MTMTEIMPYFKFLSIQAQDFIEEMATWFIPLRFQKFLSIQAQDFIEDDSKTALRDLYREIPEHSSSGLH